VTDAIHTTAGKINDLKVRLETAAQSGTPAAIEKRHLAGKFTARERIMKLVDEGSLLNSMPSQLTTLTNLE
jgi:propionyl-CoA carboxylase beta chain